MWDGSEGATWAAPLERRHRAQVLATGAPDLDEHPRRQTGHGADVEGLAAVERLLERGVGRLERLVHLIEEERPERRIGGHVGRD